MKQGYLVIAQNTKDTEGKNVDYVRMAYALALSIKHTQKGANNVSVAVINKQDIPLQYQWIFDEIIELPFEDDAQMANWKINNKWKYYHCTPYEQTVILDTDMLFMSDVSHWWDYLTQWDMMATTNVKTYRGETVVDRHYRKTFGPNMLPNVYTAFFYFNKKSNMVNEYFDVVEDIFRRWEYYRDSALVLPKQEFLSADVVYAMAMKMLDIVEQSTNPTIDFPTFTHMKSKVQGWRSGSTDDWTKHIGAYFTPQCKLKIGNYQQSGIVHYVTKNFLTDNMIKTYEDTVINE